MNYQLPPSLEHYRGALEDAVARDLAADPQPRPRVSVALRQRRRTLALAGTVGSVVAGAAVAAVLLLSSGATPAYAGWSATPAAANPVAVRTALRSCGAMSFGRNSHHSLAAPVLTEVRGRYVAVISLYRGQATACVTDGPSEGSQSGFTSVAAPAAGLVSTPVMYGSNAPGFPGARLKKLPAQMRPFFERIRRSLESTSWAKYHPRLLAAELARTRLRMLDDSGEITVAFGRVGAGVTGVALDLRRHGMVQATVEHGWYFAWWPWRGWPADLSVTNAAGTTRTAVRTP